ncbi:MAG: tRNA epoxyqueuosine(34) reductase QueG [Rhizobiales bacterium 12-68-15]|nr:MAG: tRNA epoxyqueuosine(34) reductase QueG [Rhizobiales bacterium 12-68-15]
MVCAPEVAADLPRPAERQHSGHAGFPDLCGPRLLTTAPAPEGPLPDRLKDRLRDLARNEGFDAFGVADPDAIPQAGPRLAEWVAQGCHGDMGWMGETLERRAAPRALWPDMRAIVMLGYNYGPDEDPRAVLARRAHGAISVYARGEDYHELIKAKLKRIARALLADAGGGDVKVFVDTAPLMEKPLAQAAGLGWQGKHTNVVSRERGSWLFLGAIATTLPLPADPPSRDHCGGCRACLDACPTAAFPAPYRLDARRCVSYLTIEHRGPIPRDLRPLMGNRIYGCDDCLAACPWNKFAQEGRDKRTGRVRMVRNVLVAIGNSGDASFIPQVRARLTDDAPLVRGAAVWALERLLASPDFADIAAQHMCSETDPDVLGEWRAGLERHAA